MASPQRTSSMLLASLIFFLYLMSSSARSYDSTALSTDLRVKREMPSGTKEKIQKSLDVLTNSLTVVKDVMNKISTNEVSAVMQTLASFASLAPGIGTAVAAVINLVLVFIPQKDPVMEKMTKGFAEVNRKLDSISFQISNLATDVEWNCYVSTYSKHEVSIVNVWKKFNEIQEKSASARTAEEIEMLKDEFTKFYKDNKVESSVMSLHHYLTVTGTTLCANFNRLLMNKFKCNINDIGRYHSFLSSLLIKGMILNQVYGKIKGHNLSGKEAAYAEMFKSLYEHQIQAINLCLNDAEQYMKKDVEEIAKANSPDDKAALAKLLKQTLDIKYSWYEWVVLVYDTKKEKDFVFFDLTKIPAGDITVAVRYIQKIAGPLAGELRRSISDDVKQRCKDEMSEPPDNIKVTHATKSKDSALLPEPFDIRECKWGKVRGKGQVYMFFSKSLPVCSDNPCKNGGKCKRLLDSNEWLCECVDGYYGKTCEEKVPVVEEIEDPLPKVITAKTRV